MMKMYRCFFSTKLLLFFILFISNIVAGQSIYLCTDTSFVYRLNEDATITEITYIQGLQLPLADIAISSNGDFYGIYATGDILKVDLTAGTYTNIGSFHVGNSAYTSLVGGDSETLFAIDNVNGTLLKYDILTDTVTEVARMGFTTPGDLTFYKGNVIYPDFPYVKAYNQQEETLTDIYCIPSLGGLIWGISNTFSSCGENRIIASTFGNELWEFNMDTGITTVLDYENSMMNGVIYGIASTNEYLSANCEPEVLTFMCNLQVTEFDKKEIVIYPNPVKDEINIKSNLQISRFEVYDLLGKKHFSITNPDKTINVSSLATGIYILKIYSEKGFKIEKIIIE